ncbi:hypothetical protein GT045_03425 [Streptomyces sp. SID486]|uniref:hypothetical protein n=1 Tax=Streptomyces sp. SID486 TaxID=2690264 RepID=UPI00137163C8|nr:hypothetical protein [Streptomyces sp. SID486]MYX93884.1 hypothetical protein [Streptomyces sp. SID486]
MSTPERPTASVLDVFAIADASQPRHRALVLLGAFCALRWGELVALRRRHVDLEAGMIRVRGSVSELNNGGRIYKAPKSEVGQAVGGLSALDPARGGRPYEAVCRARR